MILLTAICAALAAYLLVDPPVRMTRSARVVHPGSAIPLELVAAVGGFGMVVILAPSWWWLAYALVVVCLTGIWTWRRARYQRTRANTTSEMLHACGVLAGQLRVGKIPAQALQVAATEVELLRSAWICQQVGGEVSAALAEIARHPGAEEIADLARAWRLCEMTGASLAPAVQRVNAAQRVAAGTRRTVAAELAAAKATGRLLAGLPILGIGFGFIAGGNPLHFLTETTPGRACLCLAVTLACAGLIWTEKLADAISQELVKC